MHVKKCCNETFGAWSVVGIITGPENDGRKRIQCQNSQTAIREQDILLSVVICYRDAVFCLNKEERGYRSG